jgi:predicted DNA-binding transcriptional regulator YafY/transcription elongation factor Elf1
MQVFLCYNTCMDYKAVQFRFKDIEQDFPDEESCLEWLKNKLYPKGIRCPICNKVTKHHKVSKRHSYACDNCGNQVNPVAATILRNSRIPLKIWFKVIQRMSDANKSVSAETIQREYGLTYWKARQMVSKIEKSLNENNLLNTSGIKSNETNILSALLNAYDMGVRKQQINADVSPTKDEGNRGRSLSKRDRTARLLYLQILLWHHSQGIDVKEIARSCTTSVRTTYRDLVALESELKVPIWQEGSKRGLVEGHFLPPVAFRQEEAINIFIASRLMQNYSYLYNPSVVSTFTKLSSILPAELREETRKTIENIEKQTRDERKVNNLNKVTQAWISKHMVKMRYQTPLDNEIKERIIELYFLEPMLLSHSIYVIAYCHLKRSVFVFKLDYIDGEVEILPDTYIIPSDFHATDYITSPWDTFDNDASVELVTIKLHFISGYNKKLFDTIWHPSQTVERQSDGSVVMTLKAHPSNHFIAWYIGLTGRVEILEPEILRNKVLDKAKLLMDIHREKTDKRQIPTETKN